MTGSEVSDLTCWLLLIEELEGNQTCRSDPEIEFAACSGWRDGFALLYMLC